MRVLICLLALALSPLTATAQSHSHSPGGHKHDEANMPGLRGLDASPRESAEIAHLFRNFPKITREVENLPNGIRTTTHSTDQHVMDILISHVVDMIARVEEGRDPKILVQSPTLDIFFTHPEKLENDVEVTEAGVIVTQTSDDPEMVEALQIHAAEVTAMADRGMHALHEMMMERRKN